jgi:hypothetical protein
MTCRAVISDCKHAGEVRQKGADITLFSTNFWRPGLVVPDGYRVRPAPAELAEALGYSPRFGPDGFEYVASIIGGGSLGQTGRREPRFGADPASDGSLLWTRQPLSAASLFRSIAAPLSIQWLAPGAMAITNPVFVVGVMHQIAANHGGGIGGEVHRVIARVPYSDGSVEDYGFDWTITEDQL